LNLYNAALVTPTYYVYFTSATIVSSAVLFRGFKGTPIQILTVVLGFLQICTGVVLLQLSKSAKDVPDTAVFKGDLDQVRTVAEQEEPEYEPRADTMRGAGAIIRSISKARQSRQFEEAKKLQEEHHMSMQPIGENEQFEFDGIRRRRTIIGQPGARGSIRYNPSPLHQETLNSQSPVNSNFVRRKSIHPPLGMSRFPDEDERQEEEMHPGFLDHFRRKRPGSKALPPTPRSGTPRNDFPLSPVKTDTSTIVSRDSSGTPREHIYGLSANLQKEEDTSYQPTTSHIHFDEPERPTSRSNTLSPLPPPPPHHSPGGAKRQFSFQNPFHRRGPSGEGPSSSRPVSRSGLSFSGRNNSGNGNVSSDGTTEEERLGLVKGDSSNLLDRIQVTHHPSTRIQKKSGRLLVIRHHNWSLEDSLMYSRRGCQDTQQGRMTLPARGYYLVGARGVIVMRVWTQILLLHGRIGMPGTRKPLFNFGFAAAFVLVSCICPVRRMALYI